MLRGPNSWSTHLRLEQWQRPRVAQLPPLSSDFREHFFFAPTARARGRAGGKDDCSALSFCKLPSTLTAENDFVVVDRGGPELKELSTLWLGFSTTPTTSCLLKWLGCSPWKYWTEVCSCCCCQSNCCWILCCIWSCCWIWKWSWCCCVWRPWWLCVRRACAPTEVGAPWPELPSAEEREIWVGRIWK